MGREIAGIFPTLHLLQRYALFAALCVTSLAVSGGEERGPDSPRALCPDGWMGGGAGDQPLCLYLHPQAASWTQARDVCHGRGAFLLTVDSVISVQHSALHQFLAQQGIDQIWTGMYEDGGRQIWDEPGKGAVLAYTGPQQSLGLAKRGWYWNTTGMNPAEVTCASYGIDAKSSFGSQQTRTRRDVRRLRARRDDSSSPTASPPLPTAKDSSKGPTEKTMESFKSFLHDQGLKQFADKMSDNPPEMVRVRVTQRPVVATVSVVRNSKQDATTSPTPVAGPQSDSILPSAVDLLPALDLGKPGNYTSEEYLDPHPLHNLVKRSTPRQPVQDTTPADPAASNSTASQYNVSTTSWNQTSTHSELISKQNATGNDRRAESFSQDKSFLDFFQPAALPSDITTHRQLLNNPTTAMPPVGQHNSQDKISALDNAISSFFKMSPSTQSSNSSGVNSSAGATTVVSSGGSEARKNNAVGDGDMRLEQPLTMATETRTGASQTSDFMAAVFSQPGQTTEKPQPPPSTPPDVQTQTTHSQLSETHPPLAHGPRVAATALGPNTRIARARIGGLPSFVKRNLSSLNNTQPQLNNTTLMEESSESIDSLRPAATVSKAKKETTTTSAFHQRFGTSTNLSLVQTEAADAVAGAEQTVLQHNMSDVSPQIPSLNGTQEGLATAAMPPATDATLSLFPSDNSTLTTSVASGTSDLFNELAITGEVSDNGSRSAEATNAHEVRPALVSSSNETGSADTDIMPQTSPSVSSQMPNSAKAISSTQESTTIAAKSTDGAKVTTESLTSGERTSHAQVSPELPTGRGITTKLPKSAEITISPASVENSSFTGSAEATSQRPESAERTTQRSVSGEVSSPSGPLVAEMGLFDVASGGSSKPETADRPGGTSSGMTSQESQEVNGTSSSELFGSGPDSSEVNATAPDARAGLDSNATSSEVSSRLNNSKELPPHQMSMTTTTTLPTTSGVELWTTPAPSAPAYVSLLQCQQQHRFMCAAPAIVHLTPDAAGCESDWLGDRLLARCYRRPLGRPGNWSYARDLCRNTRAVLAAADTAFYANLTRLLLDSLLTSSGLGTQMWVSVNVTSTPPQNGLCTAMTSQGLKHVNCSLQLPFVCEKPATRSGSQDRAVPPRSPPQVLNMTSVAMQSLVCPVMALRHDDLVIWYKDGQPIPSDSSDTAALGPQSTSSANPSILKLTTDVLRRLEVKPRRMQQPALLQGLYWCRVWRRHASTSVTSRPFFVRFLDVVTLQVFVKTAEVTETEAVLQNELSSHVGLTETIARGMQNLVDALLPALRRRFSLLADILVVAYRAHAEKDEVELRTYLCLSAAGLSPQDKGAVMDAYIQALHTELVASEPALRQEWRLTLPLDQAFRLLMTEMCPEARLRDKDSGLEATFPSTPVNTRAVSLQSCDGLFTGYATCSGDLQSGAQWTHWIVENTCISRVDSSQEPDLQAGKGQVKVTTSSPQPTKKPESQPSKPNPDLAALGGVHVEPENVKDLTDRLPHLLNDTVALTAADVDIVADVIHRVTQIGKVPADVGLNVMRTVNKLLDSPLDTLQAAQRRSQTSTRILKDLEVFADKLDLDQDDPDHVRYVMPNVAMEVWNIQTARVPVIGLAAIVAEDKEKGLSEGRIVTLVNRTWNELNVDKFQVAIELPDQLVAGGGQLSDSKLAMTIYSNPGLFLSSLPRDASRDLAAAMPELNGAVVSASLTSRDVSNLKERVKLIFRPHREVAGRATRCVYWDFDLVPSEGWSSRGCVYNGTVQGRHVCLCNHLTNFAILLDLYGEGEGVGKEHETALSVLTIVGLCLSILALAVSVITFIFFKKLRQGRTQQTLFNTCVALLAAELVMLVGLKQTSSHVVCLGVAVLLHYLILVSFMWMLIEAVLQYLTFVKVLGTYISKYTLKTVLPAWGIPLIPVVCVLATDYTQYRGRKEYCWMSGTTFYYAFALPVGIIVLFNLVTFVVIMVSLVRRPRGLRANKTKANSTETNLKAAFTILVLLGLTWIFGFLAVDDARLPFQYLFTVFCSLQGFFIFLLLVARRRQCREQWRALCCRRPGLTARGQKVTPTLSNSNSTSSATFSTSGRSRSSSGSSTKTLASLIRAGGPISPAGSQLVARNSFNQGTMHC